MLLSETQVRPTARLPSGYLATLEECDAQAHLLEPWSQLVFAELKQRVILGDSC